MAKFEPSAVLSLEVVMRLTETEARFLHGIAGYEHKSVEAALNTGLGVSYTRDYIGGLYSFLKSINEQIPAALKRMDDARAVFNGAKVAADRNPSEVA